MTWRGDREQHQERRQIRKMLKVMPQLQANSRASQGPREQGSRRAVPILPSAYVLARQVDDDDDDAGIKSPPNVGTSRQRLNRDAGSRLCARLKTFLSVPGGLGLGHWAGLGCAGLDG